MHCSAGAKISPQRTNARTSASRPRRSRRSAATTNSSSRTATARRWACPPCTAPPTRRGAPTPPPPPGRSHQPVISHGNGPQVGLLALQGAAYAQVSPYPLDVLGAQTEGMIGYMIEQELGNILPFEQPLATILSMVEVDPDDPAFKNPTKPIGPVYTREEADRLAAEKGWIMAPDGDRFRRVVASPRPKRIFQIRPVKWLMERGCIVICAGGGGIPTVYKPGRKLEGAEAVVDKDLTGSLLARELEVDLFIMATDAAAAYLVWGKPRHGAIRGA